MGRRLECSKQTHQCTKERTCRYDSPKTRTTDTIQTQEASQMAPSPKSLQRSLERAHRPTTELAKHTEEIAAAWKRKSAVEKGRVGQKGVLWSQDMFIIHRRNVKGKYYISSVPSWLTNWIDRNTVQEILHQKHEEKSLRIKSDSLEMWLILRNPYGQLGAQQVHWCELEK